MKADFYIVLVNGKPALASKDWQSVLPYCNRELNYIQEHKTKGTVEIIPVVQCGTVPYFDTDSIFIEEKNENQSEDKANERSDSDSS